MLFPLFFFTAFAGGLSQLKEIPGFDFPPGYTAFQFVFVLLQSAAFSGVFTGFGVARDFEGGFAKRLLLAAPNGPGSSSGTGSRRCCGGWWWPLMLTVVALVAGMNIGGGPVDIVGLYVLPPRELLRVFLGRRARDALPHDPGAPLMQMPVFLVLFFAPVYVPLELLEGWIEAVATVEPADLPARDRPRLPRRRPAARRSWRSRSRSGWASRSGVGVLRPAQGRSRRRLESPLRSSRTRSNASTTWVELRHRCLLEPAPASSLERLAVRSVGRHGVERVAGDDDSRLDRDCRFPPGDPGSRRRPSARGSCGRCGEPRSSCSMGFRMRSPSSGCVSITARSSGVSGPGLSKIVGGDPDLPDVMEESAELEALELGVVQPDVTPPSVRGR